MNAGIDAIVIQEIIDDDAFKRLANDKTGLEEFEQLIDEHVEGYSQKRRLLEGLKEFGKKIEDVENRLIVARNVGKFKEPDPEDKRLSETYTSFELKQKVQMVSGQIQQMIDAGAITHFEKPQVLDNLRARLAKAKEAGKAKLEEKLDNMLSIVVKADPFIIPVSNIEEFSKLDKELQAIHKLEKLSSRNLTPEIKRHIAKKAGIQESFDELTETSHMWFETVIEFKPRLHQAIEDYAAQEEERKRREEEAEFNKKNQELDEAVQRKRQEAAKKEAERDQALAEKLEAKRLEAAAKPVKEQPKKQPKERKVIARVDLQELHHEEQDYEVVSAAQIQADLEADHKKRELAKLYMELAQARKEAEAEKAKAFSERSKEKTKQVAKASQKVDAKTGSKPAEKDAVLAVSKTEKEIKKLEEEKQKMEEDRFKAIEEKLAAKRLEAASKPQKVAAPPPKKEKKVATKMSLLDFVGEDDLLERLAAQEAKERAEKAAAQEAEEKEAARLALEEEAAWNAEEAAWAEQETARLKEAQQRYDASQEAIMKARAADAAANAATQKTAPVAAKAAAPTKSAPKPRPKPKERASMWGSAAPKSSLLDFGAEEDDLLERLAAQEAQEKLERAAAQEEAARLAAEEEAAWAREEAKEEAAKTGTVVVSALKSIAPVKLSAVQAQVESLAKSAAKAKPKPRIERASKWGAPVAYTSSHLDFGTDEDDLLERLAAQEAEEKVKRGWSKPEEASSDAWAARWETEEAGDQDAGAEEDDGEEEADAQEEAEPEKADSEEPAEDEAEAEPVIKAEPAMKPDAAEEDGEATSAGPSLAQSLSGPTPAKKSAPPAPKKKEKKKFGKLDPSALGFEF